MMNLDSHTFEIKRFSKKSAINRHLTHSAKIKPQQRRHTVNNTDMFDTFE